MCLRIQPQISLAWESVLKSISYVFLISLPVGSLLEKAMATHSGTFAWKIPWMKEPGRLQFMESLRVRHDWATSLSLFLSCFGEGNGNPLQCSCLENPRDGGAWWAAVYGVAQSRTRLKWLSSSSSVMPRRLCWIKIIITASTWFFFYNSLLIFIYLFLVVLGLCCCMWAFSSCGECRLLFAAVHGFLIAVASLIAEHRF